MKTIKYFFPIYIILILLSNNSCKDYNIFGAPKYVKQNGYITDTLGNGISGVRLDILKAEEFFGKTEKTDYVFYTDAKGYYDIYIDNNDYIYYIDMTHPDYIYPVKGYNFPYPQTSRGEYYEEINYQMVKKGPVKIKGDVMCRYPDLTFDWLEGVKISVLKRPLGSNSYPDTTDIYTFSDENGKFYIEYEGNEIFEFFLKPEKEGYYYNKGSVIDSLGTSKNYDPGYVIGYGFELNKY